MEAKDPFFPPETGTGRSEFAGVTENDPESRAFTKGDDWAEGKFHFSFVLCPRVTGKRLPNWNSYVGM